MEANAETRVSILEDQALMRQSLSELLEEAGLQVVGEYSEPSAFLSRLATDHPSVAIVDLGLHDKNGQVLRDGLSILAEVHHRYPDIHILVFSGCTERETIDQCYRAGASGYLDKLSAQSESVVNAVRAVARGERLFPMHLLESSLKASPPEAISPVLQSLSLREREVLTYVAAGADNLKIATLLGISERTVKAHVSSLYRKIGAENRTQLALSALQLGIRPSGNV